MVTFEHPCYLRAHYVISATPLLPCPPPSAPSWTCLLTGWTSTRWCALASWWGCGSWAWRTTAWRSCRWGWRASAASRTSASGQTGSARWGLGGTRRTRGNRRGGVREGERCRGLAGETGHGGGCEGVVESAWLQGRGACKAGGPGGGDVPCRRLATIPGAQWSPPVCHLCLASSEPTLRHCLPAAARVPALAGRAGGAGPQRQQPGGAARLDGAARSGGSRGGRGFGDRSYRNCKDGYRDRSSGGCRSSWSVRLLRRATQAHQL